MTFVNTLEDRGLFDALRVWLIQRGLSLRALFWITGALAFMLSSLAIRGSHPTALAERPLLQPAAIPVLALFLGTVALTVSMHNLLDVPAAVGMMSGSPEMPLGQWLLVTLTAGVGGSLLS